MRFILLAALVAWAAAPAAAQAEAKFGIHLATRHSEAGLNDINPGVYVRGDTGAVAGIYCNSESRSERFPSAPRCQVSAYLGMSRDWHAGPVAVGLTGGLLTGYSKAAVLPFILPSLLILDTVRLTYLPAIEPKGVAGLHASVEFAF